MTKSAEELAYDRRKLVDRIEIIEGLSRGLDNWVEVSQLIGDSTDRNTARRRLVDSPFGFTETQAVFVLDTPVSRLTTSGRAALHEELTRLRTELSAAPEF